MQKYWLVTVRVLVVVLLVLLAWQPVVKAVALAQARRAMEALLKEIVQQQKVENALDEPQPCLLDPLEDSGRQAALRETLAAFQASPAAAEPGPGLARLAGYAACLLGEYEQAGSYFQQVIRAEPQDAIASLQLLGLYSRQGDSAAARQELASGRVKAETLVHTAAGYLKKGNLPQALLWCRWAVEVDPGSRQAWSTWLTIGWEYDQKHEWQAALEVFRAALDAQADLEVDVYTGSFLYRVGLDTNRVAGVANHPESLQWFNRALENGQFVGPWDWASALILRGNWYRTDRTQYPVAIYLKDYQAALAVYPKSDWAAQMIGVVYLDDLIDLEQAETYFRVALAISETDPYSNYYLGRVLLEKGDLEGAAAAFGQALEIKPDFTAAAEALAKVKARQEGRP